MYIICAGGGGGAVGGVGGDVADDGGGCYISDQVSYRGNRTLFPSQLWKKLQILHV